MPKNVRREALQATARPPNWYQINDLVAIYAMPLDKYGRIITGVSPMWIIVPRWAKQLYRELALLGGKAGKLWCSYEYIAEQLMQVTPERARQQILALEHWGFLEKTNRPRPTGWFDSNLYNLIDPLAPLQVQAIVVRTKKRREPYQVIKLSQQLADVPEFRWPRRGERPLAARQPEPAYPQPTTPAPAIRLPEVYRKMAEAYGLVDPRWQHEAWRRFKEAEKRKAAIGRKIRKPGAFWRGVVLNVLAEIQEVIKSDDQQESDASATSQTPPITPQQAGKVVAMTDVERENRRKWIIVQAFRELMAGGEPGKVAAVIFTRPELNRYCRLTECPIEEVVDLVTESLRCLQGTT